MEPFVLNEEQYREMFGDSVSNDESFYWFSDVESASSSAEEEGLGPQGNFEADSSGRQEDPTIRAYRFIGAYQRLHGGNWREGKPWRQPFRVGDIFQSLQ